MRFREQSRLGLPLGAYLVMDLNAFVDRLEASHLVGGELRRGCSGEGAIGVEGRSSLRRVDTSQAHSALLLRLAAAIDQERV